MNFDSTKKTQVISLPAVAKFEVKDVFQSDSEEDLDLLGDEEEAELNTGSRALEKPDEGGDGRQNPYLTPQRTPEPANVGSSNQTNSDLANENVIFNDQQIPVNQSANHAFEPSTQARAVDCGDTRQDDHRTPRWDAMPGAFGSPKRIGRTQSQDDEASDQLIGSLNDAINDLQTSKNNGIEPSKRHLKEMQQVERLRPSREIKSEVSTSNIIEGKRIRKPSDRRQAYLVNIDLTGVFSGYRSAFSTAIYESPRKKWHLDELPPLPKHYKQEIQHALKDGWIEACGTEIRTLETKGTWEVVDRPSNVQVLPVMWVFTYKLDEDGFLKKLKARLCVRGDLQIMSMDDTYSATPAARSFRLLMALAAAFDLEVWQVDVVNAFANSLLDEIVYIEIPDGHPLRASGKVLRLIRALYGLRRSPKLWQQEISGTLRDIGLNQIPEEPCIFVNEYVIVMFYVDDIIMLYRSENAQYAADIRHKIEAKYEVRQMGDLEWFLNIRIIRDRANRKLWLCQDSYIDKIAARFHLQDQRAPKTPLPFNLDSCAEPYAGTASSQEIFKYQQLVGSALYASIITRVDNAKATSELARHLKNPSPKHIAAAEHNIRYLHGTKNFAIQYFCPELDENMDLAPFICASDAAYADHADRKSSEGYICKLFGGPIDWRASKQRTVTTSTTEAELLAISEAAKQTLWWKRLFTALGFNPGHEIEIHCDNRQTVDLLTKPDFELRTKLRHVDIHHHWLRQEVQQRHVQIRWVPTADMIADGLTKILPRQKHEDFVRLTGLVHLITAKG